MFALGFSTDGGMSVFLPKTNGFNMSHEDNEESFHLACAETNPTLTSVIKGVTKLQANSIIHECRKLELEIEVQTLNDILEMYCHQLEKTKGCT